jgi:hypothetical protein
VKKIGILSTVESGVSVTQSTFTPPGATAFYSPMASLRKVLALPGRRHDPEGMRRVSYSGGSFVTTNEVAEALVSLITILANGHRTQTIEIPALNDDGHLIRVVLIVGPLSELISIPEHSPWPTPDLADTVTYLQILTEMASDIPFSGFTETTAILDYDWNDNGDFDFDFDFE